MWDRLTGLRRQTTSQREMARAMGTQQSHVSDMESGRHGISLDSLERYANALGYVVVYDLKLPEELEP